MGFSYATGLPYTKMIDFEKISDPDNPVKFKAAYGEINNFRLPPQFQIDLSVNYTLWLKPGHTSIIFSGGVRNLLNGNNFYERKYFIEFPNSPAPQIHYLDKKNLGFTPNLSIRLQIH